ncbi:hypothetical protein SPRG_11176 [Saprolegnia parasitica CBS 223.65]|uniref:Uncharacterized protein n=1 Tax=Saprolegnia parasitica (strain CBS 223.65) TaxID=695850 RepID=A0A067C9P4_SAPPC|nr:hypothetical protein SPRG_11176 [Saprolegnia parasitica CBS 223.65]KDO23246.1 hypothetical protein SPRG_11176 [Saprolegnia parasitica CBS 223.65]|eukprot:XP_012206035.1 hypothetical protein SPRG_11176 [Saprolegnia parasitica CBS 223.65]
MIHHLATMTEDRKRHVYIIARLLHESAAKANVPTSVVSQKLHRVATKMEVQLHRATHGRKLGEDAIRKHLCRLICAVSVVVLFTRL